MEKEIIKNILEKIEVFNSNNFTFNEKYHTYRYNGEKYISVTTLLKNFTKPFDSDYWSRKKAMDRIEERQQEMSETNIIATTKEILGEWDTKRDNSCDLGHEVHKYIEEYYNPELEISEYFNEESIKRINKFKTNVLPRLKNFISIAQELRLFSPTMKVAGTIDGLFLNLKTMTLYILDYKTNGKLKTDNDYCFNKLLTPFHDQWENELNKYSIQLNMYKLMLAEIGIKVDKCALIYIPPSENDPKILQCKDYIPELEMYFGVDFYSKLK